MGSPAPLSTLFVGAKMLASDLYEVPVAISLGVIVVILGASVTASLLWPKKAEAHDPVVHDPLERKPPDPVRSPALEGQRDRRGG